MADRLSELQRQRALLAEHLAWIDREIAAASGQAPVTKQANPPATTALPPVVATIAAVAHAPASELENTAESILEQYRTPVTSVSKSTKTGCYIYFALLLVVIAAMAGYYFYVKGHPELLNTGK